jgi:hypothetical protein
VTRCDALHLRTGERRGGGAVSMRERRCKW